MLAKRTFPEQPYELLKAVLGTFSFVMMKLKNAKTSLKRFRNMLFGAGTESKRNLLGKNAGADTGEKSPDAPGAAPAEGGPEVNPETPTKKPRKGHGRHGATKYRDAPVVAVALPDLKSGDSCPNCNDGKVYDSPPRTLVKVIGQPPLVATIVKLEQLRCRLCDTTFTAPLPEGMSPTKYDHSCASMLAVLRYGSGMPFYRLEGLQGNLNVPLPDATQWDIVANAVDAPRTVFRELIHQAAQGDLLHIDDTRAKILSIIVQRAKSEAAGKTVDAKAINTSGIVAELHTGRQVVLFLTGHNHAGDNLNDVLKQRAKTLAAPIQMSDALACNFVGEFQRILANCLTHARRQFVDVIEHFPEPCRYVIDVFAKIYANDAHCRDRKMSPEDRLRHHQAHSAKPMQELHVWMNDQFDQHFVEPNSGLGKALRYLLNHWVELTLFLRMAGVPLDNNSCERALKQAILHRKNSMFFKTANGAAVGDIYMSIIHTCQLNQVNPFEYLQALMIHIEKVQANVALWLPWNYREQLAGAP